MQLRPFFLVCLASFICCFVYAVSASYIAFLSKAPLEGKIIGASAIFLIVFVFTLNLHRQFELNAGYPLHFPLEDLGMWRPDRLRLYCFALLALLFSQLILLAVNQVEFNRRIDDIRQEKALVFENTQTRQFLEKQNTLIQRQSILVDKVEQITGKKLNTPHFQPPLDQDLSKEEIAFRDSRYKALVIGVQHYQDSRLNTLSNTLNDAKSVATELKKMGYAVKLSEDESSLELQKKIIAYRRSLQPGDYSIIYYAGHGFQEDGKNFITSIDFKPDATAKKGGFQSIDISSAMQTFGAKNPALNMLLLDACRSWINNKQGGLAEMKGIQDSYYFVMAASPGQRALDDGGGGHSPFAKALLAHLNDPGNIDTIFNRVGLAVKKETKGQQIPQRVSSSSGSLFLHSSISKAKGNNASNLINSAGENSYCPALTGKDASSSPALVACLISEISLLNEQILEMQANKDQYIHDKTRWYEDALESSNLLAERISLLWGANDPKHPNHRLINLCLTILIASLLLSSELLRFLWPEYLIALRNYEMLKNRSAIAHIKSVHYSISKLVDDHLATYQSFRESKFPRVPEWDEATNFYKLEAAHRFRGPEKNSQKSQYDDFMRFMNSSSRNRGSHE